MTLKMQIETAEQAVWRKMAELDKARQVLQQIQALRMECKHEFTEPHPGYEHEGGHCIHCGINGVYWDHIKPR